ncbi:MAG: hypothetical protein GKR99_13570 [Rhodobacteraceae bacterium]|nr:hypothetical protein [Paracoccaceae bacterium]
MYKSLVLSVTLAALTLTAPAASAASKVPVEIDGKTTALSPGQMRADHPKMYTAYRKAQRAGNAFAANPDGPVPLGCVRFPFMIVCNHAGYWCAVGWSGGELKFNCGGDGNSSRPSSRSFRSN